MPKIYILKHKKIFQLSHNVPHLNKNYCSFVISFFMLWHSFKFFPRVSSPHPCFIPSSVFYPLIRVLFLHPCFIPSSLFYSSSVFYPPIRIRVLSQPDENTICCVNNAFLARISGRAVLKVLPRNGIINSN